MRDYEGRSGCRGALAILILALSFVGFVLALTAELREVRRAEVRRAATLP